jgi:hypothetical protein
LDSNCELDNKDSRSFHSKIGFEEANRIIYFNDEFDGESPYEEGNMAINHVNQYPVSVVFSAENKMMFEIPKCQREYTWGSRHWEDLFDDLADNNVGYFLGTIICIDISDDPITAQKREVIDGQQRLTTLSLMFAALYSAISVHKDVLSCP